VAGGLVAISIGARVTVGARSVEAGNVIGGNVGVPVATAGVAVEVAITSAVGGLNNVAVGRTSPLVATSVLVAGTTSATAGVAEAGTMAVARGDGVGGGKDDRGHSAITATSRAAMITPIAGSSQPGRFQGAVIGRGGDERGPTAAGAAGRSKRVSSIAGVAIGLGVLTGGATLRVVARSCSAWANSPPVAKRCAGSLASARTSTPSTPSASSGTCVRTGGGGSYTCLKSSAGVFGARNGTPPESISYTTMPRE
jgi:hypothetical protein